MATVKADDVARSTSTNFLNIINQQIAPGFTALTKAGNTLADGTHWQGADASKFQGTIWPAAQKDISKMQSSLSDLHRQVNNVLENITKAGGGS